jgi:hypothetical protein
MLIFDKRADLEYALHLGSPTRFSIEDILPNSSAIFGLPGSLGQGGKTFPDVSTLQLSKQLSADLQTLLMDFTGLAWLLNDASARHRPKLKSYTYHDTLLLLGYRLIQISPLGGPRPINRLENAVHLGLTMFLMTFLRGLDRKIEEIPILSELSRSASQEEHLGNELENQEVLLHNNSMAQFTINRFSLSLSL